MEKGNPLRTCTSNPPQSKHHVSSFTPIFVRLSFILRELDCRFTAEPPISPPPFGKWNVVFHGRNSFTTFLFCREEASSSRSPMDSLPPTPPHPPPPPPQKNLPPPPTHAPTTPNHPVIPAGAKSLYWATIRLSRCVFLGPPPIERFSAA